VDAGVEAVAEDQERDQGEGGAPEEGEGEVLVDN